ncbi:MAG TPA: ATP-binding cassette domain-containing protein [Solirubrobacteraceae bacterium]|nr:ATP-binding cassette domain-containing protein [Solirubrobacteraceae bacterium]
MLNGASFDVQRGEVVAIVGSRLSGKTTLLSCVAGQRVPEAGSVVLGDVELSRLSERKRAKLRQAGLVWVNRAGMSQKLHVTKIVGWPLVTRGCGCRETELRAAEMLRRVGAAHCAWHRWDDLSRWEQVLVGLAQGFALRRPLLVVMDDLLDALGEPWTRQAFELLQSLLKDADRSCGVLISVSDNDSSLYADRVWALEKGILIPTAGHRDTHAEVVPLRPDRESGGSRRVGWS